MTRQHSTALVPMAVALLLTLVCSSLLAAEATPSSEGGMTDEEIAAALQAGCDRGHRVETYRGMAGRHKAHDVVGPLWLMAPREDRPRGVILPPFLRVYLYGRARGCRSMGPTRVEEARELAGSEVWVVLWRSEDPPNPPLRSYTTSDQRVLRPAKVRYRANKEWHQPVWERRRDTFVRSWFAEDWDEKESVVAAFPVLERSGALHVDYNVEEAGRSYLTESQVFSLTVHAETWWAIAFGQDP